MMKIRIREEGKEVVRKEGRKKEGKERGKNYMPLLDIHQSKETLPHKLTNRSIRLPIISHVTDTSNTITAYLRFFELLKNDGIQSRIRRTNYITGSDWT